MPTLVHNAIFELVVQILALGWRYWLKRKFSWAIRSWETRDGCSIYMQCATNVPWYTSYFPSNVIFHIKHRMPLWGIGKRFRGIANVYVWSVWRRVGKHAYAGNIPQLPLQYVDTSTRATRTFNLYSKDFTRRRRQISLIVFGLRSPNTHIKIVDLLLMYRIKKHDNELNEIHLLH